MAKQNISKKLSAKTIMGSMSTVLEETLKPAGRDKVVAMYRIAGKATTIRTGTSQFGDWIAFKGQYKAINLLTGEEHFGSEALFPASLTDMIHNAMVKDGELNPVEIAFEVTAAWKPTDPPVGSQYEYGVRALFEIKPSDELANILGQLPGFNDVPKLAPPAAEEKSQDPYLKGITEKGKETVPVAKSAEPPKKK